MFTTIYLIRHGETINSEPKRYTGHTDVPLSEKGIKQMEQVAKYMNKSYMSHKTYNAVYCSDLIRAVKSAEIIARPHGLKPIIVPKLRERNFGIWEGMSFNEIKEKYPEEFDAWTGNPLKFSPMHGESTIELRDRVVNALDKILNNHLSVSHWSRIIGQNRIQDTGYKIQNKENHASCVVHHESVSLTHPNIAIVSHGGVNRIILCHLLGIPLENIFRIEQDYAAFNIIEFYENYPVVKLINHKAQNTEIKK